MFRRLLGCQNDILTSCEEASISLLAAAHSQLQLAGDQPNTKSEVGYNACQDYLQRLDKAAQVMRLEPASRLYRASFTINYRALFPDESRNYRVDVLDASVQHDVVIYVNGEEFQFSPEAMRRSVALQKAWSELGAILGRSSGERRTHAHLSWASLKTTRDEMKGAMTALDIAWASFENKYITELIDIEEKSRSFIMQAVECERNLQVFENKFPHDALTRMPEYHEGQRKLVAGVARLNSVANFRRKGRDDFSIGVLDDASATLVRCDSDEQFCRENADAISAARLLATDVVESFRAMRCYLRDVEKCIERVDAHLCNNPGLVARLVDFEESWEIGARYIQHAPLLIALCDLVAEIRAAGRVAPTLKQMITDCDVELFLCLPRIVWLRFLAEPFKHAELMKSLLPQRFGTYGAIANDTPMQVSARRPLQADAAGACFGLPGTGDVGSPLQANGFLPVSPTVAFFADTELQGLVDTFQRVRSLVITALPVDVDGLPGARAWELLIRRVVLGVDGAETAFSCLLPSQRDATANAVEGLMHELERWSMELQRHCPEDWNQCIALLVQCLEGGQQKGRNDTFHA